MLLLAVLGLPACARSGGGGQGGAATASVSAKHIVFTSRTFSDSLALATLAKGEQGPLLLEFDRCTFTGPVSFTGAGTEFAAFPHGAVFKDCTFEQDLVADQTQFLGRLNMVKCRFKRRVSFQNSTFMGPAGFRACAFDGDAAFLNTLFMREASFMDSHFFDVARLQSARFMAPVQFGNAVFHKNADLSLARFDEGVWFDYAVFMAKADLGSARALGPVSFRAAQTGQLLLNNLTAYEKVNLSGLITKDSTRLAGATFYKGKP